MKVYNISEHKHGPDDVLIMGTDGLWDVTSDRDVAEAVTKFLSCCEPNDPMRYKIMKNNIIANQKILTFIVSVAISSNDILYTTSPPRRSYGF